MVAFLDSKLWLERGEEERIPSISTLDMFLGPRVRSLCSLRALRKEEAFLRSADRSVKRSVVGGISKFQRKRCKSIPEDQPDF